MSVTYDLLARALMAMDPFGWTWRPGAAAAPPGTARLRRRLEPLRRRAEAEHAGRAIGDVAHQLKGIDPSRELGAFPDVPPLNGRHPVVLAHGPSLQALVPALIARRNELYVVAPFRTALRLVEAGVWPDVAVLADAAAPTAAISLHMWHDAAERTRRSIEERVTLLVDPLAPVAIHRDFAHVRLFDDGLGWLPGEAQLPFWGSGLMPSVCLPLALGATTVAVGGMDMASTVGRRSKTWTGAPMRVDRSMDIWHRLLELTATELPGCFVDLTADSVVKRGFTLSTIDHLLATTAAPGVATVPSETHRPSDAIAHVLEAAESFGEAIGAMTKVAERLGALSASPCMSPECEAVMAQIERDWAVDSSRRAALALMKPANLQSLWRLCEAGFTPLNRHASIRTKAKLIGSEVAALDASYRQFLGIIRELASHGESGIYHGV